MHCYTYLSFLRTLCLPKSHEECSCVYFYKLCSFSFYIKVCGLSPINFSIYCKVGVSVVPKPLLERLLFHEFIFNLGLNLVVLELGMLSLLYRS